MDKEREAHIKKKIVPVTVYSESNVTNTGIKKEQSFI